MGYLLLIIFFEPSGSYYSPAITLNMPLHRESTFFFCNKFVRRTVHLCSSLLLLLSSILVESSYMV